MPTPARSSWYAEPRRLSVRYAAVASLWIMGSDLLLGWHDRIALRDRLPDVAKGLAFVALTTVLLYLLSRQMQARLTAASDAREAELRQANLHLQRTRALQSVLTRAHQAVLTAGSEKALCEEISGALVGLAGLRLAWFAWVDEATGKIEPSAAAGEALGYLDGLTISVYPDSPYGKGPTGCAVREGRAIVSANLVNDPAMQPWLPMIQKHALGSSISVPIQTSTKRGAISAYAGTPDFFDPEITVLIQRLAADLAHGLEFIAAQRERAQLLGKLAVSEANHRALFQNDHVIMLLVDPADGRIHDANPAAVRFYGWPRDTLLAKSIHEINTAPAATLRESLAQASRSTHTNFNFTHRLADGRVREVEAHSGPVLIDGRQLLYSIIHDVTDRIVAERSLEDALSLNKVALEASPLGMIVLDAAGSITRVNESAARILHTTPAALLGLNLRHAPAWTGHGLIEGVEQAFATRKPRTIETDLTGPDLTTIHLAATFNTFEFHGALHLLATLEDISERRRSLARLHLLQTAIEATPSAIVITDPLGRIQWANPAFTQLTGHELAKISGRTPAILRSGRQDKAFYENLWETISRGQVWRGDLQNLRADGSVYWEHMVIAPVVSPEGTILHYVAIKRDISAQKEMELQIARTQRLESIGLLAGGIAHDLNNVLAPILMATELFKLRFADPVDQTRLDIIHKSALRGAGIVRQVLTFARGVDGERMQLQPRHLIKEVCNLLDETLPRDIEIRRDIDDDLPLVTGDATQLHQILLNLGVNSRDAMPRGGVITIGATRESIAKPRITRSGLPIEPGDYVVFFVRDTGTGISDEVMEHMFEPFYTTKPRGKGTGLGLSTVLGLVRSHGGGLDATSTLGLGTEFRILIPVSLEKTVVLPHTRLHPEIAGQGRCVLIIDDEEPIRSIIGLALEHHGFTHLEAADGQSGLDAFLAAPDRFAAVILDHLMPRLGGHEVARSIKALRPALPVILISGLLSDKNSLSPEPDASQLYGDLVLQKPFSQDDLLRALAAVVPTETPPVSPPLVPRIPPA